MHYYYYDDDDDDDYYYSILPQGRNFRLDAAFREFSLFFVFRK